MIKHGQREYEMRGQGLTWVLIGSKVDCGPSTAFERANRYAFCNGLRPPKKLNEKPPELRNRAKKTDAARWHKMHCGKGMRAHEIAKKDGVTLSLVRRTLRKYREEKWGSR